MKRTMAAVLFAAFGFYSVAAYAILVSPGSPIRVDFVFPIADPFALPARIVDHTVEFGPGGGAAALNIGEGYEIATFDANDVLLSIESHMNVADGNVIGCACTGGILDTLLATSGGHLTLGSLAGSFNVRNVYLVAYDATMDSAHATGTLSQVPEPATSARVKVVVALVMQPTRFDSSTSTRCQPLNPSRG
jgi:hypothetical protein